MDDDFVMDEVLDSVRGLKNNKAPGSDGIHAEFLHHCGDVAYQQILRLFNLIWSVGEWPSLWSQGIIVPIPKPNGSPADMSNWRPITLLSIMSKLFESVVLKRLTAWAEQSNKLAEEQGGFRKGRSCTDQYFTAHEIMSHRWEEGKPTYCCMIDVKSAYDKVWRNGLLYRLWMLGIRGRCWKIIQSMYASTVRRVRLDRNQFSDYFPIDVGVAQGSVLSPLLYALFINGLVDDLKEANLGVVIDGTRIPILLYADDIVLLADSAEELQLMLNVATKYSQTWRFKYNNKKSQIVVYGSTAHVQSAKEHRWHLGGQPIEVVLEYKYLGMMLGQLGNRSWTSFYEGIVLKCRQRCLLLWKIGAKAGYMHTVDALRLYRTIVQPLMEYGMEISLIRPDIMQSLESIQVQYIKRVLHVPMNTSSQLVRMEVGWMPVLSRERIVKLRYLHRLVSMDPSRLAFQVFTLRLRSVSQLLDDNHCGSSNPAGRGCEYLLSVRRILLEVGLGEYWTKVSRGDWSALGSSSEWTRVAGLAIMRLELRQQQEFVSTHQHLFPCLNVWKRSLFPLYPPDVFDPKVACQLLAVFTSVGLQWHSRS